MLLMPTRYNLSHNPCKGIKREKENIRTNYVEGAKDHTDRYRAVYDLANEREQAIMEPSYCQACRVMETRLLKRTNRSIEGLQVERTKGSKISIQNASIAPLDALYTS